MNTLKITVAIDRKAALLAGRILGDREEIEVSPETMGDQWPALVALLDMNKTPPAIPYTMSVDIILPDASAAELRTALERRAKTLAEAKSNELAEEEQRRLEYTAVAEQAEAWAASPLVPTKLIYTPTLIRNWQDYGPNHPGIAFTGVSRPSFGCVPNGGNPDLRARVQAARESSDAEILAHNEAAFAAALPRMQEELAAQEAAAKAKADAEAKAKKARDKAKYATRLETGLWTRETGSYNEKRYGAWWVASVDFSVGAKGNYTFGDSSGNWGKAGELSVACRPGDFIAYGQKDLRRPANSSHTILRMRDDGSMETMEKAEAYKVYKASLTKA